MNLEREYYDALNLMVTPGGVTNEKIESVEKELAVAFPVSYRQFLAKYGAGMGTGFELAGVFEESNSEQTPMWKSVLQVAKQFRRVLRGTIPNHFIPISGDGGGTTFYIDTKSEAGRVLAYGPGVDGQMVATSFEEFVVKGLRNEL